MALFASPPIASPFGYAKRRHKSGVNIGILPVDLGQPLPVLPDAAAYSLMRILVNWNGRQLGSFEIPNCHKPITTTRLREALVDHLGLRLLDPECKKNLEDLKAESYAALSRHFLSLQ